MSSTPFSSFQGSSTSPAMDSTNETQLQLNEVTNVDKDDENASEDKDKGMTDNNTEQETAAFQRKQRKKTAKCWKEMEEVVDSQGVKKAKCNYCNESWPVNKTSTTTQFNRHLKGCLQRKLAIGQNQTLKQQVLSFTQSETEGVSSIANFTYDHAKVRELAAHMVLVHEYPLSMVEHSIFNKFMKAVSLFYQKISRYTLKQDCMTIYDLEKKKIKALLKNVKRISITTDLWKSGQKILYMVITRHFVDSN